MTDLRQHMLGEAVVSNVIVGFEDSQPVVEGLELPFHVGGYGVELDLRELAAGVEVDGAGAAILDCGAIASMQRVALGFCYSAVRPRCRWTLGQQLVREFVGVE